MGMSRKMRRQAEKAGKKENAAKAAQELYKTAWEAGSDKTVYAMALLACAALNERFGFGEKRLMRFAGAMNAKGTASETLEAIEKRIGAKYKRLAAYLKGGNENVA